jgi:biotin carboxyl carrier protein
VKKGQGLIIIEAMKMQNELKSPKAGRINEINVVENQAVNNKDPLLIVE